MATNSSYFQLPVMDSQPAWSSTGAYENTGQSFTTEQNSFVADRDAFMNGKDPMDYPIKQGAASSQGRNSLLFVDSSSSSSNPNQESTWGSSVWDWANTEQGSTVIGGAIGGAAEMYAAEQKADYLKEGDASAMALAQMREDAATARAQMQIDAQMKIAMLKENRIKKHNKSINAPVNMSMRTFK